MTPQMQLSIKLLQMNTLEIEQLAREEMLENPFLEITEEPEEESATTSEPSDDNNRDSKNDDDGEYESPEPPEDLNKKVSEITDSGNSQKSAKEENSDNESGPSLDTNEGAETFEEVDVNWDDHFEYTATPIRSMRETPEEERDFTEYTATKESLYDRLVWQLHVSALDGDDLSIGEYLIGDIDGNGYLTSSLQEIAAELKVDEEDVERVLKIIQTFDPTGVGARDLAECLLIQLEGRGVTDPIYPAILRDHFPKLGQQKFREIAKALEVDEEKVLEAFREIRRCDPKPGRSISKEAPRYVEPDIYVKKVDGQYHYYLNEGDLGHLRINDYYRDLLTTNDGNQNDNRDYFRDKYRSAVWLIRNIERRKGTVLRVTEAIMDYQREFLEKGPEHIRPLTLKQIAEMVGMHEATIARVTANKYVETPRGVFLLKYFFSSSLDRDDGRSASSRSVKEMLRKMILEEDPSAPLSDSAITKALTAKGVKIARRTVAKYRDQLKILPANLRKTVSEA